MQGSSPSVLCQPTRARHTFHPTSSSSAQTQKASPEGLSGSFKVTAVAGELELLPPPLSPRRAPRHASRIDRQEAVGLGSRMGFSKEAISTSSVVPSREGRGEMEPVGKLSPASRGCSSSASGLFQVSFPKWRLQGPEARGFRSESWSKVQLGGHVNVDTSIRHAGPSLPFLSSKVVDRKKTSATM